MEHRRYGHIYVSGIQCELGFVTAKTGHKSVSMKDDLTMAVIHPFWHSCCAGGVKGGGHGVFVKIREIIIRTTCGKQGFIFARKINGCWRRLLCIRKKDKFLDGLDLILDGLQHGKKIGIDQDDIVFCMVDGVCKLFRRQPDVNGVKNRPHHGNGKETFQIPVAVPIHDRNCISGRNSQLFQHIGQLRYPAVQGFVIIAHLIPIDDFLLGRIRQGHAKYVFDQQGIGIGGRGSFNLSDWHVFSLLGWN